MTVELIVAYNALLVGAEEEIPEAFAPEKLAAAAPSVSTAVLPIICATALPVMIAWVLVDAGRFWDIIASAALLESY